MQMGSCLKDTSKNSELVGILESDLQNKLKEGDLLFQVANVDKELEKHIASVTNGVSNLSFSHVGIVIKRDNQFKVIDATIKHNGVKIRDILEFRNEDDGCLVLVGRIEDLDVDKTIKNAVSHLDKPYNFTYLEKQDGIYCSELVEISYYDKNNNKIFSQQPLEFKDKDGNIPQFWVDYYKKYNMEVPEGLPGSNPGNISRNKRIKYIYKF